MSSRETALVTKEEDLVHCLRIVDPILQFLTRATSNPFIRFQCLLDTVAGVGQTAILSHIPELARRGILHLSQKDNNSAATPYDDDVIKDAKPCPSNYDWFSSTNPESVIIGFPPPLSSASSSSSEDEDDTTNEKKKQKQKQKRARASRQNKGLSGSTKLGAKRRMAALRRSLKIQPFTVYTANGHDSSLSTNNNTSNDAEENHQLHESIMMEGSTSINAMKRHLYSAHDQETYQLQQTHAVQQLSSLIKTEKIPKALLDIHYNNDDSTIVSSNSSWILPQKAAYAGFHEKRHLRTKSLTPATLKLIPTSLLKALSICSNEKNDEQLNHLYQHSGNDKRLYCHQVDAIEAAFSGIPTIVCTSTGSGKSLCYLLPILTCAMTTSSSSLLIFPTKALAQDQFTKIQKIIQLYNNNHHHYQDPLDKIQVSTLDGDMTCHATRARVAEQCNIILTNPDTLHASILPNWKKNRAYCNLLANIRYIVVDEAHIYEGTLGAHVSLIFSRLIRLCHAASLTLSTDKPEPSSFTTPTFLASSATIEHPEIHFRLLCRIPTQTTVKVLFPSDDGSPCSSRYFFTWNPPLLDRNGIFSTNKIVSSNINCHIDKTKVKNKPATKPTKKFRKNQLWDETGITTFSINDAEFAQSSFWRRRHAADETARLLAISVASGVRCIAFAKTRCLVEWIYEKCIYLLKQDDSTAHLASRIDSYRGGYTADVRRRIEEQLFQNKLMGVVGTSALELGVDIGGVDLTLHCGYPGSYTSLMQQAGRAGRGGNSRPSFSISVCFNSPSEQYLWANPKALLGRSDAVTATSSSFAASHFDSGNIPVNVTSVVHDHSIPLDVTSIVQDHLLCAAAEFPLVGSRTVSYLLLCPNVSSEDKKRKEEGFNMTDHFLFGVAEIYEMGVKRLCEKGALLKNSRMPGVFAGVDTYTAHSSILKPWANVSIRSIEPLQYSIIDVSHPLQGGKMDAMYSDKAGSIIMHRGKKYQVVSLTQPPSVNGNVSCNRVTNNLFVFAKRTKLAYLTRALQTTLITIVKRFESVEVHAPGLDQVPKCHKNGSSGISLSNTEEEDSSFEMKGPIAGNGVITLKRTVWGYAKLSPVNRNEIARVELTLPSIEFDTNAFWVCTEASVLKGDCVNYDLGVHALSHAILAVTPMFIACSASDIDCDHSYKECTRMLIFDSRAGGGTHVSNKVWKNLDKILPAAISLLEYCATCCPTSHAKDASYDSGCPACVQGVACVNFQDGLSRRAGLTIAKRMWRRLTNSSLLINRVGDSKEIIPHEQSTNSDVENILTSGRSGDQLLCIGHKDNEKMTPRKKLRARALESAKDLDNARKRQIVVGRPSWPLDSK